jgi:hypothetical protein
MNIDPAGDHRRRTRKPSPTHELVDAIRNPASFAPRISLVAVALALAFLGSISASATVRADDTVGSGPGLCIEATSLVLDPDSWAHVLNEITVATERSPAFFPDATIVTSPDLGETSDLGAFPTIRIGIWATGASDLDSVDQLQAQLARAGCLHDGSDWNMVISHDLVLAAAESILASARLPQDGEERLISDDVEAAIDVGLYPAEQRIRTILEWNKPVFGPVGVGGSCWIDDVLNVDAGHVIVMSEAAMDVSLGGEAGCAVFEEFLDGQGAGQRAAELMPTEFSLADGSTVDLVVQSIEVRESEIVLAGAVVRG